MKKIFFILLITHCSLLIAQLPTQEWVARIPGPSNDLIGPFLAVDKLGNSYVTGTHVVNDTINILCVKYNSSGIQQWYTLYKYPGYPYFSPTGIALDSSGNAYVISDYGLGSLSQHNGLIIKFSSLNGSIVWVKTYNGVWGESSFADIKIDNNNNIFVSGTSDSSHLVIRYNTNGDSVWNRKYNPPLCREIPQSCTFDDSLNIIFTGMRTHYYPPFGHYDSVLTVKYSSGGLLKWESTYATNLTGANGGTEIKADQNGNVYIGGFTSVSGFAVYLTLKYDRNGLRQWSSIYDAPGAGDNYLNGIAFDKFNNCLFVTGTNGLQKATTIKYSISTGDSNWVRRDTGIYKNGSSIDITLDNFGSIYIAGATNNIPPGSAIDILTIKYSTLGDKEWAVVFNGPFNGGDGAKVLKLDTLNNVYVMGLSQSAFQMYDYIVIKYNQTVGLKYFGSELPFIYKLRQNYPNPFNPNTKIRFSVAKKSFIKLRIFDVLGRTIEELIQKELIPSEYEISFDGSGYTSGVYFYQLTADGGIIDTKKMIVLK